MMRSGLFAIVLLLPAPAMAQQASSPDQITEAQVISSAQTGGTDIGTPLNDPTSLSGRGGPKIRTKTYDETIGTPIGRAIGTPIGTVIGVPH